MRRSLPGKPGFGLLEWTPVKRGLVEQPDLWKWSSGRTYFEGEPGPVRMNFQEVATGDQTVSKRLLLNESHARF
jgi:hypothetical protein